MDTKTEVAGVFDRAAPTYDDVGACDVGSRVEPHTAVLPDGEALWRFRLHVQVRYTTAGAGTG